MIKNKKFLEVFEEELLEKEGIDIEKNFLILEELLRFAREMNKFSQDDWEKDIEKDARYARVINGIKEFN